MQKLLTILLFFSCCPGITAQRGISFQHLNTTNGLSYLGVNDMCTDRKGNLWVSTGNGLNMFNGKTVEKYFASEYPQLQNSNIIHVTTDTADNIWVLSAGRSAAMLDKKRKLHKVSIYVRDSVAKPFWTIGTKHGGFTLWTNKGFYTYKQETKLRDTDSLTVKDFSKIIITGFDTLGPKGYRQVFYYDEENYLFVRDDSLFRVNFKTRNLDKRLAVADCNALIKWEENKLLFSDMATHEVKAIDLITGEISYPFKGVKDQYGKEINCFLQFAEKINSNEFVFTSVNGGIYLYNSLTGKMFNYRHSLTDPASIINNTQATLCKGKKGWVFINCSPNGISYFNFNDFIGNQNAFADEKGRGYDGYVAGIATKDNDTYYIGTAEGMLQWKRNTNTTAFIDFTDDLGGSVFRNEVVNSILIDDYGRIWATTINKGIVVFTSNLKLVKHLKPGPGNNNGIKLEQASFLIRGPDGYIWASGARGICRINPLNFEVDNFQNSPLARLDSAYCTPILFTDPENIWVGTDGMGLFHYAKKTNRLDVYNNSNGLLSNFIFSINSDSSKNIYIGSRAGLNILFRDGRIKTITQKNGLLIDRAEGLITDKYNRVWIGNDVGMACYNPSDSALRTFDERYGLSIYGFRVGSYFQMPNGEFFLGTPRGIQYFHPDSLYNKKIELNVSVNKIETKSTLTAVTGSEIFKLAAGNNQVKFYFGSVDFTPHLRTYYQYKLEGMDKQWIKLSDQNSVRYNSLPPGKYVFKLQVSNDDKTWQDAENEVTIIIARAFYQQLWFRVLGTMTGLFLIGYVIRFYRKKQKLQKQELITKQKLTESRLQSLRLQMNPHFLFNALNSIQQMILANEDMVATKYLSGFSKLLRTVLTHSDKGAVSLKEEIEILKMYVELESVRFKESFTYRITCDEAIEAEEIKIPTLLIQPFVENAIWHGLMHKEGNRHLSISFTEENNYLRCVIEDNGVGRRRAQEIKTMAVTDKHTSRGIAVSEERIRSLTNIDGKHGSIRINDLTNEAGEQSGTQVVLYFPI